MRQEKTRQLGSGSNLPNTHAGKKPADRRPWALSVSKKLGVRCIALAGAALTALAICASARAQTLSTAGWTQTWSDEFNNGSSDLGQLTPTIGNPDGPPELETYTDNPQNVSVGPAADPASATGTVSALHIDTISNGKGTYTSGFLTTEQSFSQTYGLFEIRAKLPQGAGLWPAIWMMPTNAAGSNEPLYGGWPYSGEIDIMEAGNNGDSNLVQGTVHSGPASSQTAPSAFFQPSGSELPFSTSDWHTYSVEWEPGYISFFVDDQIYETVRANSETKYDDGVATTTDEPGWATPADAPAGDTMAPFDQPFHLILNVAVGDYAGTPDLTPNVPYDMAIDYIRAYQLGSSKIPTVPEPASCALMGITGMVLMARRSCRSAARL